MSLWGRFSNFISNLEKTIDEDFAKRENQQNLAPGKSNEKDIKEEIEIEENLEKEEKVDEKLTNEEIENSNKTNENNEQLQNQENTEKTLTEQEIQELIQKKENLKKQIKIKDDEILREQADLIRFQNAIDQIGTSGASLLEEFNTRKEKLQIVYEKLLKNEEDLKHELDEDSFSDALLTTAETNHKTTKDLLTNVKYEFNKIKEMIENLENEETELDDSIINLDDTLEQLLENKKNLEDEINKINEKSNIKKLSVQDLEEQTEKMKKEGTKLEYSLDEAKDSLKTYKSKIESLKLQREQILNELSTVDNLKQQKAEERRLAKATAMKTMTAEHIQKLEQERKELNDERENLLTEKQQKINEREKEIRDLQNQLTSAEIQEHELKIHLEDAKQSAPRLLLPLQARLDTLKTVYETNEKAYNESIGRLKKELLDSEIKKENAENNCKNMEQDCVKANSEKDKITAKLESNKQLIQELDQKINDINQEILIIKEKNSILSNELQTLKTNLSTKLNNNNKLQEKMTQANIKSQNQEKEYQEQIDQLKKIIATANAPTPMAMWKQLTEKSAQLEKEQGELIKTIKENEGCSKLFNETLDVVAEKQESVDQVKKIIQREKDHFQESIKQLMGDDK